MTLVDTSAWVEYLRASGSRAHHQLRRLIEDDALLHTTDIVIMEVLAGGRDEAHAAQLRRLLTSCEFVPTEGLADFEAAALLYRRCRRAGETIRALADCLIAAVAVRAGMEVLQADKDFETLARHSTLRLYADGPHER
ncbi:MAG: type II toxin-antitoxin system VapC family toxin [Candidatus Dormibacteria bacterium]